MPYALYVRQDDNTCKAVTSDEIIAQLDPRVPFQLAHIRAVEQLEREKCRYSNQDFDVLSSARSAIGKLEGSQFSARWVEWMTRDAV